MSIENGTWAKKGTPLAWDRVKYVQLSPQKSSYLIDLINSKADSV